MEGQTWEVVKGVQRQHPFGACISRLDAFMHLLNLKAIKGELDGTVPEGSIKKMAHGLGNMLCFH